jgi:anti-sigma factor RsiW
MNDPRGQQLIEIARRRELTAVERAELSARLAQHPEAREDWAGEIALTRLLAALPPAPLSPRFRENVLAAIERAERPASPALAGWRQHWRAWGLAWRLATAAVVLAVALTGWHLNHRAQVRARVAESVAALSTLADDLPSVEALAEFDLVMSLPDGPLPDVQDLARALE